jgi:hemolysin III
MMISVPCASAPSLIPLVAFLPEFREPASTWTHLIGFFAAVAGTVALMARTWRDPARLAVHLPFGFGMMAVYLASSAFHGVVGDKETINFYRRLDHCAIYLMIAGTNTPIYATLFRGWFPRMVNGTVWAMALGGIAVKLMSIDTPEWATVSIYIAMGWTGLAGYTQALSVLGPRPLMWVIAGGLFYTVGALMDFLRIGNLVPGVWDSHATFHVMVLAGSVCFFIFVWRHIVDFRLTPSQDAAPANATLPAAPPSPEAPPLRANGVFAQSA